MTLLLNYHDFDIDRVPEDAQYDFVMNVASGTLDFEKIVAWILAAVTAVK